MWHSLKSYHRSPEKARLPEEMRAVSVFLSISELDSLGRRTGCFRSRSRRKWYRRLSPNPKRPYIDDSCKGCHSSRYRSLTCTDRNKCHRPWDGRFPGRRSSDCGQFRRSLEDHRQWPFGSNYCCRPMWLENRSLAECWKPECSGKC